MLFENYTYFANVTELIQLIYGGVTVVLSVVKECFNFSLILLKGTKP